MHIPPYSYGRWSRRNQKASSDDMCPPHSHDFSGRRRTEQITVAEANPDEDLNLIGADVVGRVPGWPSRTFQGAVLDVKTRIPIALSRAPASQRSGPVIRRQVTADKQHATFLYIARTGSSMRILQKRFQMIAAGQKLKDHHSPHEIILRCFLLIVTPSTGFVQVP